MPTLVRFTTTVAALAGITFAAMLILANFVEVHPREISQTVLDQPGKPAAASAAATRPSPARKSVRTGHPRARTAERSQTRR